MTGIIEALHNTHGFIRPDDGSPRVYFRIASVRGKRSQVRPGAAVEYVLRPDPFIGTLQAHDIRPLATEKRP